VDVPEDRHDRQRRGDHDRVDDEPAGRYSPRLREVDVTPGERRRAGLVARRGIS
jgi:hypothetical protein